MEARTLVIGDIHGADRALMQVLERGNVNPSDTLIFLGDYVDGWSGSSVLISRLIRLQEANSCVFIRGNHDIWCEAWLEDAAADPTWLAHGGESTRASYTELQADERKQHLSFFRSMQNFHIDQKNRLFIHAGFSSMHGPSRETYPSTCYWDRTLWETALAMDPALEEKSPYYPNRLKLFTEIYIGHTPTINYGSDRPMSRFHVHNLDTGAGFNGKLTLMDINSKEYWQSDPVRSLYPSETGRNKK